MSDLPDPHDLARPWHGDQPAYYAHFLAMMSRGEAITGSDWHPLVQAYSEAIPVVPALDLITGLSPLVEIGAGNGYWARLLADRGGDVVACDREPPAPERLWSTVQSADAIQALQRHPDRVLFSCWPPRPDGYMTEVLPVYRGSTLALITEGPHDPYWFGPDTLYDQLSKAWELAEKLDLPHWPQRSDSLMIWRRT